MKGELADECDYVREASFLKIFGSLECLGNDPRFKVPWVWEGSTSTVLVMERVDGVSVGEATAQNLTQQDRNDVCQWLTIIMDSRNCLFTDLLLHRSPHGSSSSA